MVNYKQLQDDTNWTLGQAGAMHKHFTDAITDLQRLQKNPKNNSYFTKAQEDYTRANNAGRRVTQGLQRVRAHLKEISKDPNIPKSIKKRIQKFSKKIAPHDAMITRKTSYFIGEVDQPIAVLDHQLKLFAKKEDIDIQKPIKQLIKYTQDILAQKIGFFRGTAGLLPFMSVIKIYLFPIINDLLKLEKKQRQVPSQAEKSQESEENAKETVENMQKETEVKKNS